jgi:hypothetical protein
MCWRIATRSDLQPDGKIVATGTVSHDTTEHFALARYGR